MGTHHRPHPHSPTPRPACAEEPNAKGVRALVDYGRSRRPICHGPCAHRRPSGARRDSVDGRCCRSEGQDRLGGSVRVGRSRKHGRGDAQHDLQGWLLVQVDHGDRHDEVDSRWEGLTGRRRGSSHSPRRIHRIRRESVRMGRCGYLVTPGVLGFSSSAHDLARFGMFHLKSHRSDQRQILTDQTLDLMHSYDKGPQGTYFTLGWFNVGGGKLITDGQVGEANSNLTLIPSDGVAIATLANITAGNSGAIADDMADEIANVFKPTPGAERKKGAQRHIQRFATPYKPTPEFRGTWEGLIKAYGGDVPISLFFEDTGTVQLELDGQSRTPLSSATFNTFYELRGEFDGKIKTVESRDVAQQSKMSITARCTSDRLNYYVLSRFLSDRVDLS